MRYLCLLVLAGLFCLSAGTARADRISEPRAPQDKVLTGTLSWQDVRKPDGTSVRHLVLTAGDQQIALPVTSESNVKSSKSGETIDASSYVGKKVTVTAKVIENARRKTTDVLSVTRIAEEDASTAEAKAEGPRASVDTKSR